MRKQTLHTLRMFATDANGKEHALDVFKELTFAEDGEGGESVTKGPSSIKTEDSLDVVKVADGRYKIVSTGVELTLKDPTTVKPMFSIG
jgi:hypothetical protein